MSEDATEVWHPVSEVERRENRIGRRAEDRSLREMARQAEKLEDRIERLLLIYQRQIRQLKNEADNWRRECLVARAAATELTVENARLLQKLGQ